MTLTWETTTAAARDCEVQPDTPRQPRHAPTGSPRRRTAVSRRRQHRPGQPAPAVLHHTKAPGSALARGVPRQIDGSCVCVHEAQAPRSELERRRCWRRSLSVSRSRAVLLRPPPCSVPMGSPAWCDGDSPPLWGGVPSSYSRVVSNQQQIFDGFSWRVRRACEKNAKRRGDT